MLFEKLPLTTEQLVDKLSVRGMEIENREVALRVLNTINYYRLANYFYEFRVTDLNGEHAFKPGTSLNEILEIYSFDSDLRGYVFKAIENFEISFRRVLASQIALQHGAFAHLNPTLVKSRDKWMNTLSRLHSEFQASHEEYARHHIEKYGEHLLPPIWVTVELTTLGGLRHLYQNWANRADRQAIASAFGMEETIFDSWLEHLETVRNVCAHHARLWNRRFAKKPKLPKKLAFEIQTDFNRDQKQLPLIYNTILLLDYVNTNASFGGILLKQVTRRLENSPSISAQRLGFPVSKTPSP